VDNSALNVQMLRVSRHNTDDHEIVWTPKGLGDQNAPLALIGSYEDQCCSFLLLGIAICDFCRNPGLHCPSRSGAAD
jgi:hypothetical protein